MYVENLPWKLIIYKKIKMTIMSKLWWRLWVERWKIFVWNIYFDHHDLIRTIRIIYKISKIPGFYSQCQKCDNSYQTEGVSILLVMSLHMFSTQTYGSWTYDRSLVPVIAINIKLWPYILDQWTVIDTSICTVAP